MTLEKNCISCKELSEVNSSYYCEFHQKEIFIPENASCDEGYKNKYKKIENGFKELLRELGVMR